MLDIEYVSILAFIADCELCGYDAQALLDSGEYVQIGGTVMAREYVEYRTEQGQEQYIGL